MTVAAAGPPRPGLTVHVDRIPLLNGVDQETLNMVAASLQVGKFDKGAHVLHKGGAGEHLLFVLSGRLQVVDLTEDGREIGLNFLGPGDYFGELAIIDGLPRSASVVACAVSLVATLPRNQALRLIYHCPLVAERLLKRMASSIRMAANYRTILGIPNAFQRVFALLNQFAKVAPGGLVVIDNMPTQQEIAITVNTSRESVSRAIHVLIQHGVVEKDMRRLIIRQPDALRRAVSSGDELLE
jgi:CRP/FNR family cyclic AMP-dependent transcriptional regulator